MLRTIRILLAMVIVAVVVIAVHAALDVDGTAGEFVDLGLLVAGSLVVSLSDRELFWATPPKNKHTKHRTRATT